MEGLHPKQMKEGFLSFLIIPHCFSGFSLLPVCFYPTTFGLLAVEWHARTFDNIQEIESKNWVQVIKVAKRE